MDKFQANNSHLIDHNQVNKVVIFWSSGIKKAIERFKDMRKKDPTIQEAALFRVRDKKLIDDYIGYI